jgi:hypothetical protein
VHASANVASIAAIRAFRAALRQFAEDAAEALVALDLEVARGADYIQHDRMNFWPAQVRHSWDEVAEARIALQRRRAVSVADHRSACDEEKKALARAQQRLRAAQEKVDIVRNWCRLLNQEVEEYQGRIGRLRHLLETDLPRAVAALEHMLCALDAYTAITTPGDDPERTASMTRLTDEAVPAEMSDPSRRPADDNRPVDAPTETDNTEQRREET